MAKYMQVNLRSTRNHLFVESSKICSKSPAVESTPLIVIAAHNIRLLLLDLLRHIALYAHRVYYFFFLKKSYKFHLS